jgi:hypothetical protein
MRTPLGPKAMDRTVRFRLTDDDLEMLRDIAGGESLSVVIRALITQEHKRQARKQRRIS